MKCPNCHKAPLSFREFVVRFQLEQITCRNCGNVLKRKSPSRSIWFFTLFTTIILSIFLAVWVVYLQEVNDWNQLTSFIAAIAAIFGIGIPVEIVLYRNSKYEFPEDE